MNLITKHICKTQNIGVQNNLFGGELMAWLDESGAILAMEVIGSKSVVTLMVDRLTFKKPIKVHDIVCIYGEPIKFGNTSVTLQMEVRVHDPANEKEEVACTTQMVFVYIDENGIKKNIDPSRTILPYTNCLLIEHINDKDEFVFVGVFTDKDLAASAQKHEYYTCRRIELNRNYEDGLVKSDFIKQDNQGNQYLL